MTDYTTKKRQGLVPLFHNPSDPSYHKGAWKHWAGFTNQQRTKTAEAETASRRRAAKSHCFPSEG